MDPSSQHIKDVMLRGGLGPDIQIKLHRRGPWLVAVAHIQGAGKPLVVTARANLEQMEQFAKAKLLQMWNALKQRVAVGAIAQDAAVGFFGFVKKAFRAVKSVVKKVANSKVFRAIKGAVKSVIKSKYVGYALSAVAVVFPAVGVPAAAAFYSAQKILAAAEKGGAAAKKAVKMVGGLRKLAKKPGKTGIKARKALRVLKISKDWRAGVKRARPRPRRRPRVSMRPRRVRGTVRLPTGQRAQMFGIQKGKRLQGFLVTRQPGQRPQRGMFTARVSGDGGLESIPSPELVGPATAPMGATVADNTLEPGSLWN